MNSVPLARRFGQLLALSALLAFAAVRPAAADCNFSACCPNPNGSMACNVSQAGQCERLGEFCICTATCDSSGNPKVKCTCGGGLWRAGSVLPKRESVVSLDTTVMLQVLSPDDLTLAEVGNILNEAFGWEVRLSGSGTTRANGFAIGLGNAGSARKRDGAEYVFDGTTLRDLLFQVEAAAGVTIGADEFGEILTIAKN